MIFTVKTNEKIAKDVYRMTLVGDTSKIISPGGFVELELPGLYLRRPISVCDVTADTLTLIYKVVGVGTDAMCKYESGVELDVLTGLGNGFNVDADTKARLALGERIVEVLKQGKNSPVRVGCQVAVVYAVINGFLDNVAVKDVHEYEKRLFAKLENEKGAWLARIESGSYEKEDEEELRSVLSEMQV